jgi:chromosome segregation ATPase
METKYFEFYSAVKLPFKEAAEAFMANHKHRSEELDAAISKLTGDCTTLKKRVDKTTRTGVEAIKAGNTEAEEKADKSLSKLNAEYLDLTAKLERYKTARAELNGDAKLFERVKDAYLLIRKTYEAAAEEVRGEIDSLNDRIDEIHKLELRRDKLVDMLTRNENGHFYADSKYLMDAACKLAGVAASQVIPGYIAVESDFDYKPLMQPTQEEEKEK